MEIGIHYPMVGENIGMKLPDVIIGKHQEIYNSEGKLIEVHQKYPVDLGHLKIDEVK